MIFDQRYSEADSLLTLVDGLLPQLQGAERIHKVNSILSVRTFYSRDGNFLDAESLSRKAYQWALAISPENPSGQPT